LRVKNEKLTQRLFEYLKNNENEILYDIWKRCDGFKRSYSKISEKNLFEHIKIKLTK
jgi:hypothetical protein